MNFGSLGIAVVVVPAVALLGAAVQSRGIPVGLPPELTVHHGKS